MTESGIALVETIQGDQRLKMKVCWIHLSCAAVQAAIWIPNFHTHTPNLFEIFFPIVMVNYELIQAVLSLRRWRRLKRIEYHARACDGAIERNNTTAAWHHSEQIDAELKHL